MIKPEHIKVQVEDLADGLKRWRAVLRLEASVVCPPFGIPPTVDIDKQAKRKLVGDILRAVYGEALEGIREMHGIFVEVTPAMTATQVERWEVCFIKMVRMMHPEVAQCGEAKG